MSTYPKEYDVIVVGAGHGGCEAALAAARMGHPTLLLTINLDQIAAMSCNPAIGGLAKGHLVKEIDALGGEMARNTDQTGIQFRRLNTRKGLIHIGLDHFPAGRMGDPPSVRLSRQLESLGFEVGRLKTGTTPRLNGRTINYEGLTIQPGDENPRPFSFTTTNIPLPQLP